MDMNKLLPRLDLYLAGDDYYAAEVNLSAWLKEAKKRGDWAATVTILNEQIKVYRLYCSRLNAMPVIDEALALVKLLPRDSRIAGITFLNAATAYSSFGEYDEAIRLFRRAKTILEAVQPPDDMDLAVLYNNMGAYYKDLGQYARAQTLTRKALKLMTEKHLSRSEIALTCCNLMDILFASAPDAKDERIAELLKKTKALIRPHGGNYDSRYILACERCASAYGRFGDAETENDLRDRARVLRDSARRAFR